MMAFRSLAGAMLKGFFRDRMALFFAIVFPLMFLVLFGGIFTSDGASKSDVIQVGKVALIDDAPDGLKSQIDDILSITESDDLDDALQQLRDGDTDGVITESGDTIDLHYSAADQVTAGTLQGFLSNIVASANVAASGQPPTYSLKTAQVEDESLKSIQYVTPGLLGWAIAMGATFGAAANLVLWRRNGMLRRLRLAPIPTSSVVMARVAVALCIAGLQAVIFVALATLFFGLQLSSTAWLAIPLLVCGTLAFLSIGLFAGSICKTEEGATGLANFIILPMAFLSGSFIPIDSSPSWIQAISKVLPLRYLNDGMLDVMVRGEGVGALAIPCLFLLGFTVVVTAIAAKLFRWDRA